MAITLDFQSKDEGSIPSTRSKGWWVPDKYTHNLVRSSNG